MAGGAGHVFRSIFPQNDRVEISDLALGAHGSALCGRDIGETNGAVDRWFAVLRVASTLRDFRRKLRQSVAAYAIGQEEPPRRQLAGHARREGTMRENDETAARRAYVAAIARGARPHTAFDLAKAAYRARHPALGGDRLDAAVSRALATELKDITRAFD
jgi:hypothetical protein